MWWAPLITLLSSVALAGPGGVVNRQPAWSPDGAWVAYASNRDGAFGIWKTDGVHVRRVARDGADPAWSPNGRWVAFRAEDGLALVRPDGTGRHLLTHHKGDSMPAWSPDGRRLAFVSPPDVCSDGYAIETVRADGNARVPVSSSSEFDGYWGPAWSPDGRSIAWVHTDGVADLELGNVARDTSDRFPGTWKRPGRPSWSPDGRFVVFADDRTPNPAYGMPDGLGPMFVLNARTGQRRRLTGMWGNRPAWSPGGRRIAFAGQAPGGKTELFLVDAGGTHLDRLTKS